MTVQNSDWNFYGSQTIRFDEPFHIKVNVLGMKDDLNIGTIRDRTEEAIITILEDMKRFEAE